jgi:hypothetical protein
MKSGRAISLGTAVTICIGTSAQSATIRTLAGKDGPVVQIFGRIELGDADAFTDIVKQATAAGKHVESVQLNSTGGRLGEGAKIAAVIKVGKIPTSVSPGAVCASACFLAIAAGNPKFAGPGALIGVHKASDKGGRETALSGAATHSMARFARDLGVPSWIVDRMVATPAKQIAWLDAEDLRAMGVTMAGKPVPATTARTDETLPSGRVASAGAGRIYLVGDRDAESEGADKSASLE